MHSAETCKEAAIEEKAMAIMVQAEELWNTVREFNTLRNDLPPTPSALPIARHRAMRLERQAA